MPSKIITNNNNSWIKSGNGSGSPCINCIMHILHFMHRRCQHCWTYAAKTSTSSSMEDKSTSDSTFIVRAAKKVKRQKFRQAWLEDPEFKLWLQSTDDPLKAKCRVCSKLLRAKKSHLEKHAETDTHIMNIQQKAGASISVPSNVTINRSDTENDSSSDSTFIAPVAKKAKRQAFREAWLEKPYFKPWLLQADDPLIAKCSVCSKSLSLGKSHLQKHAKTNIHTTNIQQKAGATISVPSNAAISSSNTENDSSSADRSTCPSAKIPESAKTLNRNSLKQAFRKAWLKDPQFQLWLQETEDPHKAKCTVCFKYLRARKSHLQQHANTTTHITNMKRKAGASISAPSNATTTSSQTSIAKPSNATTTSSQTSIAKPSNAATSSSGAANNSSNNVSITGLSSAAVVITRPVTKNDSSANVSTAGPSNAIAVITRPVTKNNSSANVSIAGPSSAAVVITRPLTKNDSSANVSIAGPSSATAAITRPVIKNDSSANISIIGPSNTAVVITRPVTKNDSSANVSIVGPSNTAVVITRPVTKNDSCANVSIAVPSSATTAITRPVRKNHSSANVSIAVPSSATTAITRPVRNNDSSANVSIAVPSSATTAITRPVRKNDSSANGSIAGPSSAAVVITRPVTKNDSRANVSIAVPSSAAVLITRPITKNNSSIVPIPIKPKTANTLHREQAFRKAWLQDPQFRSWLQETEDPHKAKCTLCSKLIRARKCDLQQHAITDFHIMNIKQKAAVPISVPSNAATKSIGTIFAAPANAVITSIGTSFARTGNAAINSIGTIFARPGNATTSSIGTIFARPGNVAISSIGTSFAKPGNVAISNIGTSFAKPGNVAISGIGTSFAKPGNVAISGIGTSFAKPVNAAISSIGTSFAKPGNVAISNIGTSFTRPVNAAISSSGAVNVPSSGSTFILPVAKKVWRQTSGQTWLQAPHLKPWLQKVDDPHKAKGAVSFKYVIIGQSGLQNHANSKVKITKMVHPKQALPSTVKRTSADNVKVAEMTICIDAVEHGKKQCQLDEVPSTSSASEAASSRTRKNGETSTTTRRIHPIVHDHRYARIPGSMWKKILVQTKQIQAMKRERHADKQHIFRLKKQVTSLKRIVNKLRKTRAIPHSGLKSLEAIADKNKKNIKEKRQISKGSGNTI